MDRGAVLSDPRGECIIHELSLEVLPKPSTQKEPPKSPEKEVLVGSRRVLPIQASTGLFCSCQIPNTGSKEPAPPAEATAQNPGQSLGNGCVTRITDFPRVSFVRHYMVKACVRWPPSGAPNKSPPTPHYPPGIGDSSPPQPPAINTGPSFSLPTTSGHNLV